MVLSISTKVSKPSGMSLRDLESALLSIRSDLEMQATQLGQSTYVFIDTYIDQNRKRGRPQGKPKLSSAFKNATAFTASGSGMILDNAVTVGIGNLSELEEKFPYWKVLNSGGYVPPRTIGWFGHKNPPTPGVSGKQIFHYTRYTPTVNQYQEGMRAQNSYLLKPKKPIIGIHYLEATNNWLRMNWNKVWDSYIKGRMYKIPTPQLEGGKLLNTL